jgi:hypothetical protein
MSNVIDLPNKNKEADDEVINSIHQENFNETAEAFDPHNLEMIKRGIKSGLSMLDKAIEADETANVAPSVMKTLINLEELVSMLEHDLVGMIKTMQTQAAAQWTTQAHLQTLIDTLKTNEVVTEKELETTWSRIVTPLQEQMQKDQS